MDAAWVSFDNLSREGQGWCRRGGRLADDVGFEGRNVGFVEGRGVINGVGGIRRKSDQIAMISVSLPHHQQHQCC